MPFKDDLIRDPVSPSVAMDSDGNGAEMQVNQDKVDFVDAFCLEKVDIAKLHRVTDGSAKP